MWWWTPEIIISTDDNGFRRALSCSLCCVLLNPHFLWENPTVFLLWVLCLITDYHCHLLSSICYCTNDEMRLFKQLNQWQKPQLLQWLSPLISNHFSNPNQRHSLACTFFPSPWKSSNEHREQAPNFQCRRLQTGRRKEKYKNKRKSTIVWNKRERTSFYILKSELKGMQMSSHPVPSQVTGMSGPGSPRSIITRHPTPPAKEVLLEEERGVFTFLWL